MEATPPTRRPIPWVGILLAFGLGLRAFHYLRGPSVWHDEAALIVNVLGKGFRELLGPLFFAEAAPPLFLWVERAVALLLGDGTYALRLLPFLGSCLALVLFTWTARRLLAPAAVPWAVLLMACSDRLLWHSCEAKPYALDVLAAVVLIALFTSLWAWPLAKQCLVYATLAPLIIFLSYPGCYLYGGLLVALLPALWRERKASSVFSYGLLVSAVFVSFVLLLLGPIHAQRHADMTSCWLRQFPDWSRPASVPGWMLFSTLDVVRYCFEPAGHALAFLALAGGILLWRQGQRRLVVMLALPLGLALGAACVGAYPYGGARVEVYAAPGLALLIAAAVPQLWVWLQGKSRYAGLAFALVLLAPVGQVAFRAVAPWPRADCAGAAAYVQQHLQPADAIAGNHWEYEYYFRKVPQPVQHVQTLSTPGADRLWVILSGSNAEEEQAILRTLPADWQPTECVKFALTNVYLFRRTSPSAGQSGPPRNLP